MAIRKIINEGDEILRKKSKPVTIFDKNLENLLVDMEETMNKANGAGIAAVQVGVLKRAFIILDRKQKVWIINPTIISSSGKNKYLTEGCLSLPGKVGEVQRPNEVVVRYQDVNGNFVDRTFIGYSAKAFCHEYDHLDGILYSDKATVLFNSDEEYEAYKAKQNKQQNKKK